MTAGEAASSGGAPGQPAGVSRPPFTGLKSRDLKRALAATAVVLVLVAAWALKLGYHAWAAAYLFAGVWVTAFLTLTPLIIKAFMFDRRPLAGLVYGAGKLVLLAILVIVLSRITGSPRGQLVSGTAVIAGLTTPLLVVTLMAVGRLLNPPEAKTPPKAGAGS